jgi:hypothetical protein
MLLISHDSREVAQQSHSVHVAQDSFCDTKMPNCQLGLDILVEAEMFFNFRNAIEKVVYFFRKSR